MKCESLGSVEVGRETGSDDVGSELVGDVSLAVVGIDSRWEISVEHQRERERVMTGFEGVIVSLISLEKRPLMCHDRVGVMVTSRCGSAWSALIRLSIVRHLPSVVVKLDSSLAHQGHVDFLDVGRFREIELHPSAQICGVEL